MDEGKDDVEGCVVAVGKGAVGDGEGEEVGEVGNGDEGDEDDARCGELGGAGRGDEVEYAQEGVEEGKGDGEGGGKVVEAFGNG